MERVPSGGGVVAKHGVSLVEVEGEEQILMGELVALLRSKGSESEIGANEAPVEAWWGGRLLNGRSRSKCRCSAACRREYPTQLITSDKRICQGKRSGVWGGGNCLHYVRHRGTKGERGLSSDSSGIALVRISQYEKLDGSTNHGSSRNEGKVSISLRGSGLEIRRLSGNGRCSGVEECEGN